MKPKYFLSILLVVVFSSFALDGAFANAFKISEPKTELYNAPMQGKQRLAYCYTPDKGCGGKAANEWCKTKGYKSAKHWEVHHQDTGKVRAGRYIGSDAACKGRTCDLFGSITCSMGPPTFF